jgi:hypothetical protein
MSFALPEAFTQVLDQLLESIYGLETFVAPTVVLGMYQKISSALVSTVLLSAIHTV